MNKIEAEFLAAIKAGWKEEIEQAIDKLKRPKRTEKDKWFRRMWYRAERRAKRRRGPRITYD